MARHMNIITEQNFKLSGELQRFLETDEVVKSKLNRKSAIHEIKEKVDMAIRKSIREVEARRSPGKGRLVVANTSPLRGSPTHLNYLNASRF
jgi:hypothetical protein